MNPCLWVTLKRAVHGMERSPHQNSLCPWGGGPALQDSTWGGSHEAPISPGRSSTMSVGQEGALRSPSNWLRQNPATGLWAYLCSSAVRRVPGYLCHLRFICTPDGTWWSGPDSRRGPRPASPGALLPQTSPASRPGLGMTTALPVHTPLLLALLGPAAHRGTEVGYLLT